MLDLIDNGGQPHFDGGMPRRAFTLLELMLAMLISIILIGCAMAGAAKLLEANAIGTGAQMVQDGLAEARQDAVTQNLTVEVRVYAAPGGNGFDTLQLRSLNADGTTAPLARRLLLPTGAVIDGTATHSSLVTTNSRPAADAGDPFLDANTRCFHFLPAGGTDLAPPGPWMLTVRSAAAGDPSHFPSNWACITVDPVTGRAQIHQP